VSTITPREFAEQLSEAAGPGGLPAVLLREMRVEALKAEAEAKDNATYGPEVRTGRLRASIAGVVDDDTRFGYTITIGAGSNPSRPAPPYARIQEEGGTIRPRRRKYLRIPLGPAKTAAGVDRYPTSLYDSAPDKFFVSMSKAGNLLLRDRITGEPWYLLEKESHIRGEPYLEPAARNAARRLNVTLRDLLANAMDEVG
jgi:hypothetical protein